MPIDVAGNTIRIQVKTEDAFQPKTERTITIDKAKGIQALIARLKDKTSTAIKTLIFDKEKWTTAEAQKWVKEHKNFESVFIKDVMYTGTFPHPQTGKKIKVTSNDLNELSKNSNHYLESGGNIPIVFDHPESDKEKMHHTAGYIQDTFVEDDILKIATMLDNEATQLVVEDKIKSVSAGIVYGVQTGHKKYNQVLDHVALVTRPYLTKQEDFKPINAENKFTHALMFTSTEEGETEITSDLQMVHKGKLEKLFESLFHIKFTEEDPNEDKKGGNNMAEKELQEQINTLTEEKTTLETENKELKTKVDGYETENKEADITAFSERVDGLIKDKKLEPAKKDGLIATYKQLQGTSVTFEEGKDKKDKSIADVLLESYEDRKPKDAELGNEGEKIRVGDKTFDFSTAEGRNEFSDYVQKQADKEGISYKESRKKILLALEEKGGT